MANIITGSRIMCSIMLLFFPAFSPWFYVLYLLCGFTDMIDGAVAKRTRSVSEFGSKFDTVADFIFIVVCLIKLIPLIDIPTWLWIWIALIAVIKIINVVSGFVYYKRFIAVHTVMNKITGLLLFIFPLTLSFIEIKYSTIFICGIATFAAVQEGHFIRSGRLDKYNSM
jgi:phosphatidylglycerophosphate synthase